MDSNINYCNLANIKTAKQKDEERRKAIIDDDIASIEQAIN